MSSTSRRSASSRILLTRSGSSITVGELQIGVLATTDVTVRASRPRTLSVVSQLTPPPIEQPVAAAWALVIAQLR